MGATHEFLDTKIKTFPLYRRVGSKPKLSLDRRKAPCIDLAVYQKKEEMLAGFKKCVIRYLYDHGWFIKDAKPLFTKPLSDEPPTGIYRTFNLSLLDDGIFPEDVYFLLGRGWRMDCKNSTLLFSKGDNEDIGIIRAVIFEKSR